MDVRQLPLWPPLPAWQDAAPYADERDAAGRPRTDEVTR